MSLSCLTSPSRWSARGTRLAGALLEILLLSTSLMACKSPSAAPAVQEEPTATEVSLSLVIEEGSEGLTLAQGSAGRVRAQAFTYNDVKRILIDVIEKDSGKVFYRNFDMSQDEGTRAWYGKLPFVPRNKLLSFKASAFGASGPNPLFTGITDQTLTDNFQKVYLSLSPFTDKATITLPRIRKILIPSEFASGQTGNISFSVEGSTGEALNYSISVDGTVNSGAFYPVSGQVTLLGIAGTFVTQYAAPTVTSTTQFTHTVRVTNSAGHSITTTFTTTVKPGSATAGVNDTVLVVQFNPVINSLVAGRIGSSANVSLQALVSDDAPASELVFKWSFDPAGAVTFTQQAATTVMQGYTTALTGKLSLEVTDHDGLGGRTTLYYQFTPDQFPDQPIEEGALSGINSLSAGASHTCALFNQGTLRCWGYGGSGQLGYGSTNAIGDNEFPYRAGDVPVEGVAVRLAVGGNHTCALLEGGLVRCWGRNQFGQLGYNTTENVGDGEAIASYGYVQLGGTAKKLAAGLNHTCALMDTGKVRCWGNSSSGQLGYGDKESVGDNELPYRKGDVSLGASAVLDITAGAAHTCALMEGGKVRCWGNNTWGQLGLGHTGHIGDNELPSSVAEVSLGGKAVQLTAGYFHTCAVLETGAVRCWGLNGSGQLGYGNDSDIGDNELPSSVGTLPLEGFVLQLAAGQDHTCALLSTGTVKCWGLGLYGQLGYGNTTLLNAPPSAPVNLGGNTAFQIAAGGYHTCALLSSGKARCWGLNNAGQLGYSRTDPIGDNEQPTAVGDIQLLAP